MDGKLFHEFLVVAATLAACGDNAPLLSSEQTSEHFDLRYEPDDPQVCDDAVAQLESHYRIFRELTGLPSSDERIEYWKYPSVEAFDADELCSAPPGRACARRREVYTYEPFHQHELIHTYLYQEGLQLTSLLNEGAAVTLGCEDIASPLDVATIAEIQSKSLRELLRTQAGFDGDDHIYAAGSLLVKRLVEQYGVTRTVAFIIDSAGASAFERFEATFGTELEDFYRVAISEPLPAVYPCIPIYECAASQRIALGETSVLAKRCDGGLPSRVFSLDAPSAVQLEILRGRLELSSCDNANPSMVVDSPTPVRVQLDKGDYVVKTSPDASLLVTDAPDLPLSSDCLDAESQPFVSTTTSSDIRFAVPSAPSQVRYFAVGETRTRLIVRDIAVEVCATCADMPTDCSVIDATQGFASFEGEGAYVVVIPPEPSTSTVRTLAVAARE